MKTCRCRMLKTVQALSFAVHETVLYLDGHPDDRAALDYYTAQKKKLDEAIYAYETTWGPLTANGAAGDGSWSWIKGPWPWKYDTNVCEN